MSSGGKREGAGTEDMFNIVPNEAGDIYKIYCDFADGKTIRAIQFELNERNIPAPKSDKWCVSTILSLLQNEKYAGDIILQKTYKPDLLSDRRINNGERNRYEIKDHHIAIVNRKLWNIVQIELKKRRALQDDKKKRGSKVSLKYPFSNKIICGGCGAAFRRSLWHSKNIKYYIWVCPTKVDYRQCKIHGVQEAKLETAFVNILNRLIKDKTKFLNTLQNNLETIISNRKIATVQEIEMEIELRQAKLLELTKQFTRTAENFLNGEKLVKEIEHLRSELTLAHRLQENIELAVFRIRAMDEILNNTFYTFNGDIFTELVDKVIIRETTIRTMKKLPPYRLLDKPKHTALFIFKCGLEIEEPLN